MVGFKYISCSYLSNRIVIRLLRENSLNTSHVLIYLDNPELLEGENEV